jgi:hypothetical protein
MACRDILHLRAATNPFLSGQYKNAVVKMANVKIRGQRTEAVGILPPMSIVVNCKVSIVGT